MPEPTKKCPYCFTRNKVEATRCEHCDKKIGEPDAFNIAKKPFNWFGYLSAIVTTGAFLYFMYWLFFLKGK